MSIVYKGRFQRAYNPPSHLRTVLAGMFQVVYKDVDVFCPNKGSYNVCYTILCLYRNVLREVILLIKTEILFKFCFSDIKLNIELISSIADLTKHNKMSPYYTVSHFILTSGNNSKL